MTRKREIMPSAEWLARNMDRVLKQSLSTRESIKVRAGKIFREDYGDSLLGYFKPYQVNKAISLIRDHPEHYGGTIPFIGPFNRGYDYVCEGESVDRAKLINGYINRLKDDIARSRREISVMGAIAKWDSSMAPFCYAVIAQEQLIIMAKEGQIANLVAMKRK